MSLDAIQNMIFKDEDLDDSIGSGAGYTKIGGNITINYVLNGMKLLAQNVQGPDSDSVGNSP